MKDTNVIAEIETDDDIVFEIDKLLNLNGLKLTDITEFVPKLGPGSFTGLKNGVAVCNVLNWALGLKGIDELKLPEYGSEPNIQTSSK